MVLKKKKKKKKKKMMMRRRMEKAVKMTEQRRANLLLGKVEMEGKDNLPPMQVCRKYPSVEGIWKTWNPGSGTRIRTVVIYLNLCSAVLVKHTNISTDLSL